VEMRKEAFFNYSVNGLVSKMVPKIRCGSYLLFVISILSLPVLHHWDIAKLLMSNGFILVWIENQRFLDKGSQGIF
jgi:hypothetical protein